MIGKIACLEKTAAKYGYNDISAKESPSDHFRKRKMFGYHHISAKQYPSQV
ncbi:hypothetical protein BREVNS_1455 [Brevinematales bacterium NS]|nr:hypothetical protein BREVNS_1455 [Brevinematales bacterium NS]